MFVCLLVFLAASAAVVIVIVIVVVVAIRVGIITVCVCCCPCCYMLVHVGAINASGIAIVMRIAKCYRCCCNRHHHGFCHSRGLNN